MREKTKTKVVLTDTQREIILALAECDLTVRRAAQKLYRHTNTVYFHVAKIKQLTGKDPLRFYDLIDLLEMAIEKPQWISCAERLPDEHVDVQMCWAATGTQAIGFYTDESWNTYSEDGYYTDCEKTPTHWKNVGALPKGE